MKNMNYRNTKRYLRREIDIWNKELELLNSFNFATPNNRKLNPYKHVVYGCDGNQFAKLNQKRNKERLTTDRWPEKDPSLKKIKGDHILLSNRGLIRLSKFLCDFKSNLTFIKMVISKKKIGRIIVMASKFMVLSFSQCRIEVGDLSIPDNIQFGTRTLSFNETGHQNNSNWDQNYDEVESLLKAISECKLKNSLSWINLDLTPLTKYDASQLLKKYYLRDIVVNSRTPQVKSNFEICIKSYFGLGCTIQ
ncbi:unnamed protein product [Moneuplotes crassus]|uniref:Uncharacterized protein n=1 Tax=Euplotes crassus TaxID=5936 RepID=A0AAD1XN32_EUPCR|nr:unnamed protein product [Moneuplotes crassus]